MRGLSLLIATVGVVLFNTCSSNPQSFRGSTEDDEPVRMASESLVVKSYKEVESSTVSTTRNHSERFEEYQVYQGVMGRPGIDFPVYPQIPATSFSCRGVNKSGYYADLETDCQVFHICDGNRKISFLCPNGTIFRQSHLICDWWFRVDCGKSIELYEESAEQLAADQNVYKARSEERERRRKHGKSEIENARELASSEVYALDEPFHLKNRKTENRNHQSTTRTPLRNSDSRKSGRHSKKVIDTGVAEKFLNYNREKPNEKTEKSRKVQLSTPPASQQRNSEISFIDNTTRAKYQAYNSISSQNNKENFQQAESGSLVEDLHNRRENFEFNNSFHQTLSYNSRGNIIYSQEKINSRKSEPTTIAYNQGNAGFSYSDEKNINFKKEPTANAFNDKRIADNNITYTTEYFNYESKRTNQVDRQETLTPIFHTTRKGQSSRYRSSTTAFPEKEKQFFAETTSFHGNGEGESYSEFQNPFNTFDIKTTTANYKMTFYTTGKRIAAFSTTPASPMEKYNASNLNLDFYRTSTQRPVKQHSKKVTIYPSTNLQTTFASPSWQTTTYQPYVETTTSDRFTVEDIYFTTATPDKEIEFTTETQQQSYYSAHSTPKPDIDISLQELNINKTPPPMNETNSKYEDFREGLDVPPSSGPHAIRSFALYFATTNNNLEEGKTTAFSPNEPDVKTTLTPFEIKKKEVVKQVDELVQQSTINGTEHISHSEELPDSLTIHIQNSYSALFLTADNHTTSVSHRVDANSTESFETTAFESFTEEPHKINKELTKNDLDSSQSRGLVEPDPHSDTDYSRVSPDLRELAQVFTKALSAYLDDPEAFRRVLSEIRPTEPTIDSEVSSTNPLEYPSATQEDDEVLDFSDVTKSTYRKKTSTVPTQQETITEYFSEAPATNANDIENFVLPLNDSSWVTNIELTAPLLENLDQSQSRYYTPPSYVGTTNAIAEEINNEFTASDRLLSTETDSYLPIKGSVDDPSLPRYGGFQNNTNPTVKYSSYGPELTSTYIPYGADLTSTATPKTVAVTTFNPNSASFFNHFSKNESGEGETQLAKELNNLVLLQKFTTPRGKEKETTTAELNSSTVHVNDVNQYQDVKLGNGEVLEKNVRGGKALYFPPPTISSNHFEPDAKEINLELSPPPSTPKGFLITYSVSEPATYLPKATASVIQPITYRNTETYPTSDPKFENFFERLERLSRTSTTSPPSSIERLAHLQETLMFNTNNLTHQQRDHARVSVEEMMGKMNMTDATANTIIKVMEMAVKNETYRRLVLLLVNDKSGKNKTVEESRLSLLKALLTPVINPPRTIIPLRETSRLGQSEQRRRNNSRRSKSINSDYAIDAVRITPPMTTPLTSNSRKPSRGLKGAESNYKSGLGNLGVIRRTIENSKNKQVRINSLDDALLDSDSRAVELLRSLYSLAARWG